MSDWPERFHALDALRAAMMLLGLVLHSAASYTRTPLGDAWPYHDPHTNVAFDLLVFFIHLFRMPLFFVVAGFFAALLYSSRRPRALRAQPHPARGTPACDLLAGDRAARWPGVRVRRPAARRRPAVDAAPE